jgi:hypothetical protein
MKETYAIEPWRGEGFAVYRYDVYPRHSVLAGQERRTFLDVFETLYEAQGSFPEASVFLSSDREGHAERLAGAINALPGEDDADPHGDWEDSRDPYGSTEEDRHYENIFEDDGY